MRTNTSGKMAAQFVKNSESPAFVVIEFCTKLGKDLVRRKKQHLLLLLT